MSQTTTLPKGWGLTRIGEIATKCEQRKPDNEIEFIYIDIGSIDRDLKRITEPQRLIGNDAPSRARKIINTGDVLVSLTRPNLNAVALVSGEFNNQIASTGFEVIKPVKVDSRYIFALVRSKAFINSISGKVQGALYPASKSDDVREYQFPLPPLAEQQQIAAKLDELLAQVDNLKTRLDTIPKILKRFRRSVLSAAMNGKLTEDWRIENSIFFEDNWFEKPLKNISEDVTYGYTSKSSDKAIGPHMLRITDIQDNRVDWSAVPYCEIDENKKQQYLLKAGDLVFARTGATVGKSFLIRENPPESVYASYLIRVRCNSENSIEYLALFFQSNE